MAAVNLVFIISTFQSYVRMYFESNVVMGGYNTNELRAKPQSRKRSELFLLRPDLWLHLDS